MVFDFCYTAEITLTAKNVMAVLSAVKFLQIDSLKEGGVEFLEDLISADHWREIYSQAAQLNAKSLVKSCLKEYDDEISDVDLRGFSLEKSFTLLKYRKDDKPSSKLFQMVKYRIKCCTDNMQTQYFKELVDSVNFEGMTRKHWETLIQNDLIKAFPSTQTKVLIIHDTKKDHPDVLICAGSMIAARKGSKHIRSSVEIYSTKYQRIRFFLFFFTAILLLLPYLAIRSGKDVISIPVLYCCNRPAFLGVFIHCLPYNSETGYSIALGIIFQLIVLQQLLYLAKQSTVVSCHRFFE